LADLPRRLPAVRRPVTEADPHVQVWLNASAARALGWGDQPTLVAAVEGWEATVTRWAEQSKASDLVDLAVVRDLAWTDPDRRVVRWSAPCGDWIRRWPAVESELRRAGSDPQAVGDCLAGEMILAVRPRPAVATLLRTLAQPARPVHGDGPDPPAEVPTEDPPIARRLKAAFDPHGLLPEVPRPWKAGA
jgi:hypothetical protein